jgi:hypothetical protein
MNFVFLATAVVSGLGSIFILRILYQWLGKFSQRSATDVPPFLQKLDLEYVNGVFHPEVEDGLRQAMQPEEFKEAQWRRIQLAIHYCMVMSANAWVIQSWTVYDRKHNWGVLASGVRQHVKTLRVTCMQCRLAAFMVRLRLHWWIVRMALLPFAAPPSFKTLLRVGSSDMIEFYEKLREHAAAYSLIYGNEFHDKLMEAF